MKGRHGVSHMEAIRRPSTALPRVSLVSPLGVLKPLGEPQKHCFWPFGRSPLGLRPQKARFPTPKVGGTKHDAHRKLGLRPQKVRFPTHSGGTNHDAHWKLGLWPQKERLPTQSGGTQSPDANGKSAQTGDALTQPVHPESTVSDTGRGAKTFRSHA